MSLSKQQRDFMFALGNFLCWVYEKTPYEVTGGDLFRDPRLFGNYGEKEGYGHPKSNHKLRLAIDLNLWKDGEYVSDPEEYRILGEKWEEMGGGWGGRFGVESKDYDTKIGWDANHFEWPKA